VDHFRLHRFDRARAASCRPTPRIPERGRPSTQRKPARQAGYNMAAAPGPTGGVEPVIPVECGGHDTRHDLTSRRTWTRTSR
jgi:hypothetical protein